ncbi:unnamed protein product [Amoebophrya sp. A25]|nr:unnamed protein product [Amoebophrya sp. A25]|eukprot:GSA25T00004941001.1
MWHIIEITTTRCHSCPCFIAFVHCQMYLWHYYHYYTTGHQKTTLFILRTWFLELLHLSNNITCTIHLVRDYLCHGTIVTSQSL